MSLLRTEISSGDAAAEKCAALLLAEYLKQEGVEGGIQDVLLTRGICLTQIGCVHEILLKHGWSFIAESGFEALKCDIAKIGYSHACKHLSVRNKIESEGTDVTRPHLPNDHHKALVAKHDRKAAAR